MCAVFLFCLKSNIFYLSLKKGFLANKTKKNQTFPTILFESQKLHVAGVK